MTRSKLPFAIPVLIVLAFGGPAPSERPPPPEAPQLERLRDATLRWDDFEPSWHRVARRAHGTAQCPWREGGPGRPAPGSFYGSI